MAGSWPTLPLMQRLSGIPKNQGHAQCCRLLHESSNDNSATPPTTAPNLLGMGGRGGGGGGGREVRRYAWKQRRRRSAGTSTVDSKSCWGQGSGDRSRDCWAKESSGDMGYRFHVPGVKGDMLTSVTTGVTGADPRDTEPVR